VISVLASAKSSPRPETAAPPQPAFGRNRSATPSTKPVKCTRTVYGVVVKVWREFGVGVL
jgi:hypothetical protein